MRGSSKYPRWRLAAPCVLALLAPLGLQATSYSVIDLQALGAGLFPNGTKDVASYINNAGQVAGLAFLNGSTGASHAFLYNGIMEQDLGVLPGGSSGYATGINANGQVSGNSDTSNGTHAFLYNGSSLVDLPPLGGAGTNDSSAALNAGGTVVGYTSVVSSATNHAYRSTGVQDLGVLSGGSQSNAVAINTIGQIAGNSGVTGGYSHAFYYDGTTVDGSGNPVLTDIGFFNSAGFTSGNSTANAINASGEVVGNAFYGSTSTDYNAFVYNPNIVDPTQRLINLGALIPGDPSSNAIAINDSGQVLVETDLGSGKHGAYLYSGGIMTALPTLGGAYTTPSAFNSTGQVVGTSSTATGTDPFLWSSLTGMTDLNSLTVASNNFLSFNTAVGINDSGQIIGQGTVVVNGSNQTHSFLLTPDVAAAPEPSTFLTAGLAFLAVFETARRKRRPATRSRS